MLTEKDYCNYDTCHELMMMGLEPSVHYDSCHSLLLYEAQKWLRKEKGILILPDYNSFGWFCGIHYPINSVKMFKYTAKEVNSYEEALLEGIKEAVKILKENKL